MTISRGIQAGHVLFRCCNYIVFLMVNMRQKDDQELVDILERMHWGVNIQADLDIVNSR